MISGYGGSKMTAFGVVRFRPKSGRHEEFENLFRNLPRNFEGLRKFSLIKTADGTYCSIGEWDSFDHMVAARPKMIGNLDTFRHTLDDFGDDRGVTDAISGEAIIEISFS